MKYVEENVAEFAGLCSRYMGSIEGATVSVSVTILGWIADAKLLAGSCSASRGGANIVLQVRALRAD